MRSFLCAVGAAALLALPRPVHAQTWSPSVNQRMDPQTSQSDGYVGVSLGQLIMALGLTLQGAPPPGLDDIRLLHPKQTAEVPRSSAGTDTAVPVAGPTAGRGAKAGSSTSDTVLAASRQDEATAVSLTPP